MKCIERSHGIPFCLVAIGGYILRSWVALKNLRVFGITSLSLHAGSKNALPHT